MSTTLTLEELLSRPAVAKRLTAAGETVRITDRGKALWTVQAAGGEADTEWMDEELDAMLKERKSGVSGAELILEARG